MLHQQDHLASRMEDYKGDGPKASKMLVKLFPTKIQLQPPQVTATFFVLLTAILCLLRSRVVTPRCSIIRI